MAQEKAKPTDKRILSNLQSKDSLKVIETIQELREAGNASYIPVLIEMLHLANNPEIKSKIITLLSDLKHSDSIPLIIDAIRNEKYASELKDLVSICWENGLDFSNYLALFVDLVIEEEFMVAFEAYTVITNMTESISEAEIAIESAKIKDVILDVSKEKQELLYDILHFLPTISK